MIELLWKENSADFSVVYPITEILRRAKLKVKIHDRSIPMTSDAWGMFPQLVERLTKFIRWENNGITHVKVFYDTNYYMRNAHTIRLMDPLHIFYVLKYEGIR